MAEAGAGAGAGQGPPGPPVSGATGAAAPRARPGWAGLPEDLLVKVAETVVSQTEAGWAAQLKGQGWSEEGIQEKVAMRGQDGNCLVVFALVCREWRKAQLQVGGPLCMRVESDVIAPGRVELAKWALAEGCPLEDGRQTGYDMALAAAKFGHMELVQWLVLEFAGSNLHKALCEKQDLDSSIWIHMGNGVMFEAAGSGNLELVQWLRAHGCDWCDHACGEAAEGGHLEVLKWLRANGCPWDEDACMAAVRGGHLEILKWLRTNGCPWDSGTCYWDVRDGHVEVLRWARENGCLWTADTRDLAAAKLGYTDDFGNLALFPGLFPDLTT